MSIVDLDRVSDKEFIAQYVLMKRGRGLILPFSDYEVIDSWMEYKQSREVMVEILDETLDQYYAKRKNQTNPSLKGLDSKISQILKKI